MSDSRDLDVVEGRVHAEPTRLRRAQRIVPRVDRRQPDVAREARIVERPQQRRPRHHLPQAWEEMSEENPSICPRRAAMGRPERYEMANPARTVQALHVVAGDQAPFGVADDVEALAPVIAYDLLDARRDDLGQFIDGPCVVATEETAELDAVTAVSGPLETAREPHEHARRREESVHEQYRPFATTA